MKTQAAVAIEAEPLAPVPLLPPLALLEPIVAEEDPPPAFKSSVNGTMRRDRQISSSSRTH